MLDEIMERIVAGGGYLVIGGAFLLLALIIFAVSAVIGEIIFGDFMNGIAVGLVVIFGLGCILANVGQRI